MRERNLQVDLKNVFKNFVTKKCFTEKVIYSGL